MQETLNSDTSNIAIISPKKGAEDISVNSEFTWGKLDNAIEYEIQLSDHESFSNIIASLSVDTNRVAINGLPDNSKLYWRVRKVTNDQPQESWSQISDFKTEQKSENTSQISTSLQFPAFNSTDQPQQTNLEWAYVINATNYQLQVATDKDFENIFFEESTTETELSISELGIGQTYYWRVLANVQGKETTWSDTWNYSTTTAPSSAIELVYPQDDSDDEASNLTFVWQQLEGVESYNIQIATDASFQNPVINEVTADTSFKASKLDVEKNYFWRIRKATGQTDLYTSAYKNNDTTTGTPGNFSQLQSNSITGASLKSSSEGWSNTWSFRTRRDAKPRVQLSLPANYSANLSPDLSFRWEPIDGVSTYRIMVSTDDSFTNPEYDKTVSKTSYKIDNLQSGQTYFWGVQAEGSNKWSDTWVFKIGEAGSVPAVTLKSPNNDSSDLSTNLTFNWNKIDGVSRYRFMVATDNTFSNPEYDRTVDGTSSTIDNLDANETYYWGVKAAGSDQWSDTWIFKTGNSGSTSIPRATLTAPENNSSDQPTEVTFKWKKIDGVSKYRVMVSTDNSFENPEYDKMVSQNNYVIDNLESNETYYWGVQAEGSGKWSETWSFETGGDANGSVPRATLTAPENNSSDHPKKVTFKWKKIDGVSKYRVMVSTDNSFNSPEYDETVSQTSYTIDDLETNETYYWGVKANGSDEWSRTWSLTTGDAQDGSGGGGNGDGSIPAVTLSSPSNNSPDLSTELTFQWEAINGVSDYRVMVSTDNSFSNPEYDATVSKTSYTINDLENGQTYYWGVRAAGSNPWSETWSFTTEEATTQTPQVTLISPSNNSTNQPTDLTLEWQSVSGVTNYQVQLATDNTFANPEYDEIVSQTFIDINGLESGQTYYWAVRPEGANQWSNTWSFTTENSTSPPPPTSVNGIVGASNGNFILDGQPFRFAGTNAYYLPNYEKIDAQFVTSTLDAFEDAGIEVVRMWGFYDGYDCGYSAQDANENVIQTAPGEYSEEALRDLDNVIAKGKERGIRFLIPFVNYWDELGGICQYNTWAGASNPSTNMSYFINSNSAQNWFKDYISMLLNRVNTVTGVAYKNEPAIFGWEIMNEGRNTGANPAVLRDWYREIAQYIKSIDSNHILATGEEGFDEGTPSEYSTNQYSNTYVLRAGEGTSYIMNTSIPEIDFGSAHWYPSDWGFGYEYSQSLVNAQHAWFNDHKEIAEAQGKPFMVGEYGYAGWGNQTVLDIYNDIWNYAEQINLDGSFLWQFTTDYVKCYEFGGNICWPAGRQDANLYNSYKDHIQSIRQ